MQLCKIAWLAVGLLMAAQSSAALADTKVYVEAPPWTGRAVFNDDGSLKACNLDRANADGVHMVLRLDAQSNLALLFGHDDWLLTAGSTMPAQLVLSSGSVQGTASAKAPSLLWLDSQPAALNYFRSVRGDMEADLGGAHHNFAAENLANLVPALERCVAENTGRPLAKDTGARPKASSRSDLDKSIKKGW